MAQLQPAKGKSIVLIMRRVLIRLCRRLQALCSGSGSFLLSGLLSALDLSLAILAVPFLRLPLLSFFRGSYPLPQLETAFLAWLLARLGLPIRRFHNVDGTGRRVVPSRSRQLGLMALEMHHPPW